jgi:hypothetical protein
MVYGLISMEQQRLRYIWVEVHNGRGNHGDFLRAFASAYVRADPPNEYILRPAAEALVAKYNLQTYGDTDEKL